MRVSEKIKKTVRADYWGFEFFKILWQDLNINVGKVYCRCQDYKRNVRQLKPQFIFCLTISVSSNISKASQTVPNSPEYGFTLSQKPYHHVQAPIATGHRNKEKSIHRASCLSGEFVLTIPQYIARSQPKIEISSIISTFISAS